MQLTSDDVDERPRLLLLLASAEHPHRNQVCATLAWLAADEGLMFECYFGARATGSHQFASGPFVFGNHAEMRGGTLVGGHHLEALLLVLQRFDCEAACLGKSPFDSVMEDAQVRFRSRSPDIARFYREVFDGSSVPWPDTMLVVGDGRTASSPLGAFAFPEVVNRRLLAVAEGDDGAVADLRAGLRVETLWARATPADETVDLRPDQTESPATETAWMAARWENETAGYLLGDGELAGRWTPTAVRRRWVPIHGAPQLEVIRKLAEPLRRHDVVFGRQYDDRDFLALSKLGTSFQLVDPGRPPFPVLGELPSAWPEPAAPAQPDDAQLLRWASEGRVLSTLLFWTGMVRELECLYALSDVISLTQLSCGVVLTTESYAYMPHPPLTLTEVSQRSGGLAETVELILASAGAGATVESATPPERFASTLQRSVDRLAERLGGRDRVPRGWWPTMDAALLPRALPRLRLTPEAPYVRIRYQPKPLGPALPASASSGRSVRGALSQSRVRALFEPQRPFSAFQPGSPRRSVLTAVRDAGFEFAFTLSSFAGPPRVVCDVPGIVGLTYTAGRWDGWTPFVTVNDLSDLRAAEKRLLATDRPGWLTGTIDASLWAFTGPVWERGRSLSHLCRWLAGGGSSGRIINTVPSTVARYARLLADRGMVDTLASV